MGNKLVKREKLKISDIPDIYGSYIDVEGIQVIEENIIYIDSSKGYHDIEMIFFRESDGKFFKVEFSRWSYGEGDLLEKTAIEVFRRQIITYEYI